MAGGARGTQKQRACLPSFLLVPWCREPQSKRWEHFFGRLRHMLSSVLVKQGQVWDHHYFLGCGWREPDAAGAKKSMRRAASCYMPRTLQTAAE